jgi:hypothetical protein
MTNVKLWEKVDQAASKVQTWPDWKKGSTVNTRTEQDPLPPPKAPTAEPKR